ncbi:unnamed protein product, partial [Amoebophrya sp. A25]
IIYLFLIRFRKFNIKTMGGDRDGTRPPVFRGTPTKLRKFGHKKEEPKVIIEMVQSWDDEVQEQLYELIGGVGEVKYIRTLDKLLEHLHHIAFGSRREQNAVLSYLKQLLDHKVDQSSSVQRQLREFDEKVTDFNQNVYQAGIGVTGKQGGVNNTCPECNEDNLPHNDHKDYCSMGYETMVYPKDVIGDHIKSLLLIIKMKLSEEEMIDLLHRVDILKYQEVRKFMLTRDRAKRVLQHSSTSSKRSNVYKVAGLDESFESDYDVVGDSSEFESQEDELDFGDLSPTSQEQVTDILFAGRAQQKGKGKGRGKNSYRGIFNKRFLRGSRGAVAQSGRKRQNAPRGIRLVEKGVGFFKGNCWICGKNGHRARECTSSNKEEFQSIRAVACEQFGITIDTTSSLTSSSSTSTTQAGHATSGNTSSSTGQDRSVSFGTMNVCTTSSEEGETMVFYSA